MCFGSLKQLLTLFLNFVQLVICSFSFLCIILSSVYLIYFYVSVYVCCLHWRINVFIHSFIDIMYILLPSAVGDFSSRNVHRGVSINDSVSVDVGVDHFSLQVLRQIANLYKSLTVDPSLSQFRQVTLAADTLPVDARGRHLGPNPNTPSVQQFICV